MHPWGSSGGGGGSDAVMHKIKYTMHCIKRTTTCLVGVTKSRSMLW